VIGLLQWVVKAIHRIDVASRKIDPMTGENDSRMREKRTHAKF
jgi:hypothetical protein